MTLRYSRSFCPWVLLLITTGHIIHRLNMKDADYGYKYHKTSESSNGIVGTYSVQSHRKRPWRGNWGV